jgi:hypothetical protein
MVMTRAIMRDELLDAIQTALSCYLDSNHGAEVFGCKTELTRPTSHRLRLDAQTVELGRVSFEIVVNDF